MKGIRRREINKRRESYDRMEREGVQREESMLACELFSHNCAMLIHILIIVA